MYNTERDHKTKQTNQTNYKFRSVDNDSHSYHIIPDYWNVLLLLFGKESLQKKRIIAGWIVKFELEFRGMTFPHLGWL